MGALNIIISGFILFVFLLVFMQPILILGGVLSDTIDANNKMTYGTNSDGTVVETGYAIFGADLVVGLVLAIGFAFFLGFIIWAGRGGRDPYEEELLRRGL